MDLFDKLGSILPFLIFALITILGNLGDKKKPKVNVKTKPFPKGQKLPDIKPPASQEQDSIQLEVHNPYQSYLEKKYHQEDLAQSETLKAAEGDRKKLSRVASSWGWRIWLWHRLFCKQRYWASLVAGKLFYCKKRKDWCINEISIYCGTCV